MSPPIVRAILKSTNSLWFPFPTQLVSHKQWWSKPLQQALHSLQCLVRSGITMGGGGGDPKLLFLCFGMESILDECYTVIIATPSGKFCPPPPVYD